MNDVATAEKSTENQKIDFVWLELTNLCNLSCTHCYSESSPHSGQKDILTEDDYVRLIREIKALGGKSIQFIGGEPTLNKSLPKLIEEAYLQGFEFIEVFTNLVRLPQSLLEIFVKFNVAVATSFYSSRPGIHDSITTVKGSFQHTVKNISRVVLSGLKLRAGIIIMDQNQEDYKETWDFLDGLGVKDIGSDHLRHIGRANNCSSSEMKELCGSCAGNILSIGPDGVVAPCNMSKAWPVGSVLESDLKSIVQSEEIKTIRRQIGDAVREAQEERPQASCDPKTCGPYSSCCPSTQSCFPCEPNSCNPCYPKG